MLNLSTTSSVLRMTPGTAGQIASSCSYVDASGTTFTPGGVANVDLTTTTVTSVVAAPASSTVRNIKGAVIANESTSVTTTLLVELYDGSNTVPMWNGTLLPGERIILDDGGVWWYYGADGTMKTTTVVANENVSVSTISAGYAADTYLAGSAINMPASGPLVGSRYHLKFDMVKTAAGVATFVATVRYGTAGSVSDAALLTFTFTAGSAVADTGTIELDMHFRTVGTGTAAVVVGSCEMRHQLAATGLTTMGTGGSARITSVSSGFASAVAGSILGVSVNGGASFSGTNTLVEAQFKV